MKLRTIGIISTLALALLAGPLPAEAQQADKLYRIGYLHPGNIAKSSGSRAFFQGLRDLGYVEGRNIIIERRSAKGRRDRLPELAAELVRLKVDVIVCPGAIGKAALKATRAIPIVVTVAGDSGPRVPADERRRPEVNKQTFQRPLFIQYRTFGVTYGTLLVIQDRTIRGAVANLR